MIIGYGLHQPLALTETFLQRELQALLALGHDVVEFHTAGRPLWQRALGRAAGGSRSLQALALRSPRLQQQLREAGVEHLHAAWAGPVAPLVAELADALHLPWSFSAHARDLWSFAPVIPRLLQRCSFATSCTRLGTQALQAAAPAQAGKVLYVPHGLPLPEYAWQPWRPPEGGWQWLAVGRMVPKKGLATLLQALAELYPQAEMHLTIVGEGPQRRELENRSEMLGLHHAVTFTGALPHEKVKQLYRSHHALVLPCEVAPDGDRDGLPNVLLEAAACGLPMVTTPTGGVGDLVDTQSGWLVASASPADLARVMRKVMFSPAENMQKVHTARGRVEAHYDLKQNILPLHEAFLAARAGHFS